MFDGFFNAIFGGLIRWHPGYAILIISFILTLLVTIIYKYTTNQEYLKRSKEEIKEMQKNMRDLKDKPDEYMKKQKEFMEKQFKLMGHTMKPTLYTFIPLLIIFWWLRNAYVDTGKVLFGLSWIWIYIISAMIFSILLRKILKVS